MKIKVNSEIIFRQEGDEALLFDPETGKIKILNETGVFIWKLLDGTKNKAEIVNEIVKNYEVNKEVAEKDLDEFLFELEKIKYIYYE